MKWPNLPEATVLVGTTSSTCNHCGMPALPHEKNHDWAQGYSAVDAPERVGCGIEWTHIFSSYVGQEITDAVARMRPDLEYIPNFFEAAK